MLQSGNEKDVVELTDSNFDELVMRSDDMWLVEFYAPWCGHCKSLEPHWVKAATELKGKVKLGKLDATVHTVMSNRYGVSGIAIRVQCIGDWNNHGSDLEYMCVFNVRVVCCWHSTMM